MRETSAVFDKDPKKQLKKVEKRLTKLLKGKVVKKIFQHRKEEIGIEFEDETRFFIDWRENENELDISITGNFDEDE